MFDCRRIVRRGPGLYCRTLTKGSNSWTEISHKCAKCVCQVHWHQCNIIISWLKYLSAGLEFLLQTWNGSRICQVQSKSITFSDLSNLLVASFCRSRAVFHIVGWEPERHYHYSTCIGTEDIVSGSMTQFHNLPTNNRQSFVSTSMHYSTMFLWEPEGCYYYWFCTEIVPFWFSVEHRWIMTVPVWHSTDNTSLFLKMILRELKRLITIPNLLRCTNHLNRICSILFTSTILTEKSDQ